MSSASLIRSAAATSILLLAGIAYADTSGILPARPEVIPHAAGQTGNGVGYLNMPFTGEEGYFSAILEDQAGNAAFTIDAFTTFFLPSGNLWGSEIFMSGGIYGYLREAPPPGVHLFRPPAPIGLVEGLWSMDDEHHGSVELLVWMRGDDGGRRLAGSLSGRILARVVNLVHPPMDPDVSQPGITSRVRVNATGVRATEAPGLGVSRSTSVSGIGATSAGEGQEVPDLGRFRRVGAVLSGPALNPALAVEEDLDLARARRVTPASGSGATAAYGSEVPSHGSAIRTTAVGPRIRPAGEGEVLPVTTVANGYPSTDPFPRAILGKVLLRYRLLR